MKYTIVISTSPHNSSQPYNALQFCKALLRKKHTIFRIFFYGEGVYNAANTFITPQGEVDLNNEWLNFINEHQLDSVVCIATALRRGTYNKTEAMRYEKTADTMLGGHDLSGLGQLIEATSLSDRVITFA